MTEKILGNHSSIHFVISAPAGTGKTTLVKRLLSEFKENLTQSISCTTRAKRPNDVHGKDYHFLSEKVFLEKANNGDFLEYAKVFDNYYGTLKETIADIEKQNKHSILVIDTQGALELKSFFKAVYIFISPPSHDELKNRLVKRATEKSEVMETRLAFAKEELEKIHLYDYHIINDDLDIAYQALRSIIIAEDHRF